MDGIDITAQCPACGSALSREPSSAGLCPGCILELALESPSLLAELEEADEEATLAYSREAFTAGQVLGRRYRIRALLGRGGMGEVWRATDLKLRVDVALKALRPQLLADERALETLRQEVRVAREVVSPNVCRVFDLVELDGQELVSMEYVDGVTLLDILKMRAPLELTEAREIAAQFLAGLEAIHDAGLVHRDVKPENLMMTRSGRVVLMDFGIAKGLTDGTTGTVSGTPAYMAPEQARGGALDARADVFSAGVVLAEMIAPGGVRSFEARQRVWQGIHREPPELQDSPWAPVLKTAVASHREQRYGSAAALARALEEVTLRVAGADDVVPYPGLAAFSEADAEYFFGRELEVEAMWKKLQRPHLLGLIGPSGTGKSSFLRAGLLPVIPTGWQSVILAPGNQPFSNLARALVPELTGDTEALQLLTRSEDAGSLIEAVERWRRRHAEVLVILDQFEELFTQNPSVVQERFAELLSRLALEADVHVLLVMRDDFLAFCSHHESLAPVFSELTPLKPLTGSAIRRALVQPALKCGYKFEDETLVDEMVSEVTDERGALPLLAFAASRLWDHRDREQGLLTREAYEHIGGVGGALAQHAEQTLERIGQDRVPVVRELFRNLVTAQSTRAARDRDELLSVFVGREGTRASPTTDSPGTRRRPYGERGAWLGEATEPEGPASVAAQVLDALIDARLLTSYEIPAEQEGEPPHQRIEIIHESLLTTWPRLVRWQTQDADSAQLRDQVRQAAQMWLERGKPQDLLWTGTSFGEYQLWRERYEGGLSENEAAFGDAMTDRAERRKRRRRLAIAAAFTLLLAILAVVGVSRQQAVAAARRAEAQKLLALGQVELETWPTVALAYATASLELADSPEARLFALRALAAGPPAAVLHLAEDLDRAHEVVFSPDGDWAVLRGYESLQVVSRDGRTHRSLESFSSDAGAVVAAFDPPGEHLFGAKSGELRVWSIPDFQLIEEQTLPEGISRLLRATPRGLFAITQQGEEMVVTMHALGGEPQLIGRIEAGRGRIDIDGSGRWLAFAAGSDLFLRSLEDWGRAEHRIGSHESEIEAVVFHPAGDRVATKAPGEVRTWSTGGETTEPLGAWPTSLWYPTFDPTDRFLTVWGRDADGSWVDLWDLEAPADASAWRVGVSLPELGDRYLNGTTVEPGGAWLATGQVAVVGFWPLSRRLPRILPTGEVPVDDLAFTPDGASLVSSRRDGELRLWGLEAGMKSRVLARTRANFAQLDIDRAGRRVVVARQGGALVVPLDGGTPRELEGFGSSAWVVGAAIDATGRLVATSAIRGPRSEKVIRIWDLETGESWTLGPTEEAGEGFDGQIVDLAFRPDGSLVSVGDGGLRVWSPRDKTYELFAPTMDQASLALFGGGRYVAYTGGTRDNPDALQLAICDLENGSVRTVPGHGAGHPMAVDPSDTLLVSGGLDGIVRVGPVAGGEPHLLIGHDQFVNAVAVSPDGQWIASSSDDSTIRLWPMPDLSRPPLHTLPHAELLAKLRSLTNVRVEPDQESSSGWRVKIGPFPGWAEVPTW